VRLLFARRGADTGRRRGHAAEYDHPDRRPEGTEVEHRVEAAFDRFNRAVMIGLEATPALFVEALEAEGLHLVMPVTAVDRRIEGYAA
jgi:hypothetical protein